MNCGLVIIGITSPLTVIEEGEKITTILRKRYADIVHIRKPAWEGRQIAALIEQIPSDLWPRLRLHDHFELLRHFPLGGVHLNSRNPDAPENAISVSRSLHSVEQLPLAKHYDYVTLSPVFDSISKEGYKSAFELESLKPLIEGKRVVALGGVTPEKFPALREAGFYGGAMLGHFWNS